MFWHPMWGDGGWGYGFAWPFMSVLHVLWWVLLVAGAIVLFRTITGGRHRNDTALDILRERYARGEIDAAEYEERRRQLKAS